MYNGRGWFRFLSVIATVAAISFSCDEPPAPTPTKGLSISKTEIKVGYNVVETSLSVVARLDWTLTVTEGDEWLGVPSVTFGEKGSTSTIRFNFTENGGETARRAKVVLTAVGEEEPYECVITQTAKGMLSGVNEWIYNEMLGWYYWNDAVKAAELPQAELPYDQFLLRLVANAYNKGAYDEGNPRTFDGYIEENPNTGARQRYYYSYITRTPKGTRSLPRLASESIATTFGFDFKIITMTRDKLPTGIYQLLVTWVREGSPAYEKGLRRGMWISKYNGAEMNINLAETAWDMIKYPGNGSQMTITVDFDNDREDDATWSLTATEMTASPIIHHDVLTTAGGRKTAYLFLSEFLLGDNKGTDRNPKYEFVEELRTVFQEFKTKGATELIIDLRYNPGGYVYTCQVLTSLAADVDGSKVFSQMKRNPNINDVWQPEYGWRVDNPQKEYFLKESATLGLPRVYVLATEDSASASEFVINSLRGVDIEVVHIGTTTNGKNVGMDHRTDSFGGWDYEMKPITFRIYNAKNESDYTEGFEPQHYIRELRDALNNIGGVLYPLGDKNERLLKAALTHIDGGTVTSDPTTRADDQSMQIVPRLQDPRRGGMIYIPRQAQTTE